MKWDFCSLSTTVEIKIILSAFQDVQYKCTGARKHVFYTTLCISLG